MVANGAEHLGRQHPDKYNELPKGSEWNQGHISQDKLKTPIQEFLGCETHRLNNSILDAIKDLYFSVN